MPPPSACPCSLPHPWPAPLVPPNPVACPAATCVASAAAAAGYLVAAGVNHAAAGATSGCCGNTALCGVTAAAPPPIAPPAVVGVVRHKGLASVPGLLLALLRLSLASARDALRADVSGTWRANPPDMASAKASEIPAAIAEEGAADGGGGGHCMPEGCGVVKGLWRPASGVVNGLKGPACGVLKGHRADGPAAVAGVVAAAAASAGVAGLRPNGDLDLPRRG